MRVGKLLRAICGLCSDAVVVVVVDWEVVERDRPMLRVWVRPKVRRRGRCGRCGALPTRFVTVELVGPARRVDCGECGPTVAMVPWARHDSAFTRAFEDFVVHNAMVGNKQRPRTATRSRRGRSVNAMCARLATEALGRVDLLDGLGAIAIDEVKYEKGHKYLMAVCNHFTGKVIWAAEGRSKATVGKFFDALGDERAAGLSFVTADGAEWIRTVVAARVPEAVVCIDTFHVVGWATDALDEVRRQEWNKLRAAGAAGAAKEFKGLRFLLRRNWENLTVAQRGTIRDLETANRRTFRGLATDRRTQGHTRPAPQGGPPGPSLEETPRHLAAETGLRITVCHYPPGTSKWNKIEHRLFSFISMNWRGRPLTDIRTIVELIANTTTTSGLTVQAAYDPNWYPTGVKITDRNFNALPVEPHDWHGDWNYTISPS